MPDHHEIQETEDTAVGFLSAMELRQRFRRRELSPVEVTEAILRRIEHLNPRLVAFITVTADVALSQARAAERAYGPGGEPGLLAGIPISIKDLTPTRGIRTTRGSLLYKDWIPDEDAPFTARVLSAGAVLIGKTNTPEFGWKADTTNRIVGTTHNPWRYGTTAGGSSGGAAAAVAAGMGPLAQGSDGGGSIRIPASFCGIFGHKPSFGLVPQYPPSAFGDLSHLGPMTRTVRDAALLLDATAGGDPRDRLSWSSAWITRRTFAASTGLDRRWDRRWQRLDKCTSPRPGCVIDLKCHTKQVAHLTRKEVPRNTHVGGRVPHADRREVDDSTGQPVGDEHIAG